MTGTSNRLPALTTPRLGLTLPDEFVGAQRQIDQWFDQLFNGGRGLYNSGWSSPMSYWEDNQSVHLECEIPGVSKDDLEIVVHNDTLRIACERKAPEEGRQFVYNERRYGRFERVVKLPEGVDQESINAELRDGILSVTLQKLPEAQPKRISVKSA